MPTDAGRIYFRFQANGGIKRISRVEFQCMDRVMANPVFRAAYGIGRGVRVPRAADPPGRNV